MKKAIYYIGGFILCFGLVFGANILGGGFDRVADSVNAGEETTYDSGYSDDTYADDSSDYSEDEEVSAGDMQGLKLN